MPSQLPSSFASAAAGQNRESRGSGRGDSVRGSGSGEWPRSNGTRTFRRPSTTPFNQTASTNSVELPQNPTADAPSIPTNNQAASFDTPGSFRYSKEELLEIYKNTHDSAQTDASTLYMPNWNPNQTNGSSARGWGKSGDSGPIPQDPTVCWDPNGLVTPIGLDEMTPEERELFAGDVNSTLKIPQQNKDGVHQSGGGPNGRKSSVSANTGTANYPVSSPSTASRPGTRRRETGEASNPFPSASVASPTASRFSRDDPWLSRRGTDLKDSITDEPEQDTNVRETLTRNQSFTLGRGNILGGGNFGSTSAASLWGSAGGSSTSGIGAFGSFAMSSTSTIGDKRQGTGGSRLAHLIPAKDSADSPTTKASPSDAANPDLNRGWRPRQRTDTDPFGGEDAAAAAGSAILGGAQENSPPSMPSQLQRGNIFDTPVKGSTGDFGMSGLNLGNTGAGNGPASPSETNPYRSPLADRVEDSHDDSEIDRLTHPGPSNEASSGYNTLPRSFGATAFDGSDRSQTSSVGAKGFPSMGSMTGWPAPPPSATPDRERQGYGSAFGASIFNPLSEIPTTGGLGGLGGVFGAPSSSGLGRGASKLGSLFPQAMQTQAQSHEHDSLADSLPDLRQGNPLGAIGRGVIGTQSRDTGSPVRTGGFGDIFPDAARAAFTSGDSQQGLTATAAATFTSAQSSGEPMAARTMVMPDRMRWVYLDPQGTMQGPFNGLEMNDWYKANFFTPDLRVKRLEDPDFEPLGQLIRRIGNSREPFLVPQMGVPHGPPPPAGSGFAMGGATEAVPPLQSAFPSFGRTLTAAQQNDLERRKQEEQLYHARQRELAHHHHTLPFNPMRPGIPALHHHSSAHSLQSQPSFGSISSPIGMAPQSAIGPIGPNAGFFDGPLSMAPIATPASAIAPPETFPPDLNFSERQLLANIQATGTLPPIFPPQQVRGPGNENAGLRSQLPGVDQLQKDSQGFDVRLKEFEDLRAQHDAEEAAAAAAAAAVAGLSVTENASEQQEQTVGHSVTEEVITVAKAVVTESPTEVTVTKKVTTQTSQGQQELSLSDRVRKTQADAAAAAAVAAANVNKPTQQPSSSGLPMPFPPPQQSTPLAAPTAQRPASNLPSRYGDRSATGTPDTSSDGVSLAPPPTAPWAVQPGSEAQKGPSLKEIQEAEAKKAAKREEAAAAVRRAALEQEAAALREREKAAAANVGLPATSTWGTGSPVGAASTGSPWKQPASVKASAAGPGSASTPSKKTLAEIQREEELRKQKAREAAARQSAATSAGPAGKRYADLASKASAPPGLMSSGTPVNQPAGGGWSTVGAGGKVKIPTGPAAQTRSASATVKVQPVTAAQKVAPKTIGLKDAKGIALEEFKKWLHRELSRGLVGIENVDHFAATLLEMPLDPMILSEAVYGYSTTMDGRHFAEEFVRRKKLADKGVVDKESSVHETKTNSNGGWNEVAKKGGNNSAPKEDNSVAGFKIVPSKKSKGKK